MKISIDNNCLFSMLKKEFDGPIFYILSFIEKEQEDDKFINLLCCMYKNKTPNLFEIKEQIKKLDWSHIFSSLKIEPGVIRRQQWRLSK